MATPLVEVTGVSKAFGGVQALADVSLDLAPSEVHALCGENGAGKSTLIKILAGTHEPDAGEVRILGARLSPGSVAASEAAGIAVIHQEPVVFPHLGVDDNLFVGREPRRAGGLLLDRPRMRREAKALLLSLGQEIDPGIPVGDLSVAQRQMVAIARALSRSCRLLIMDEPTASLSARESDVLFRTIRRLRSDGVTILYVSHRLEEIFALADRVTVLRDGRLVETCPAADVDRDGLIRMMVGRSLGDHGTAGPRDHGTGDGETGLSETGRRGDGETGGGEPISSVSSFPPAETENAPATASPPHNRTTSPPHHPTTVLRVSDLTRDGAFRDVSLAVQAGEIVGLAGLVGAGRSEVARALFGIDAFDAGRVTVSGEELRPGSVQDAIRLGIALVPEDRQHQGLVLPMPVETNLALVVLRAVSRLGFPSARLEAPVVERLFRELGIRAARPGAPAQTLSGGNQQKVVLGKWLAASPRVLLLDEPTRGVDVGAKAEVHRLVRRLASEGAAVVVISSELPEVLALCDRILVMRAGTIVGEFPRAEATQESILALALGQAEAAGSTEARRESP